MLFTMTDLFIFIYHPLSSCIYLILFDVAKLTQADTNLSTRLHQQDLLPKEDLEPLPRPSLGLAGAEYLPVGLHCVSIFAP